MKRAGDGSWRVYTLRALRIATAAVWIVFGLVFKVFDVVPRHKAIVATFVGADAARPVTLLIGAAEASLGVWILTAKFPRTCATVQTIALTAMNTLELVFARDLLLAPLPMVCLNAAFLTAVWIVALDVRARVPA